MPPSTRKCLECGTAFQGRSDKKFCSDQCRTAYNNHLNSDNSHFIRNVTNALRRNRRILSEMNPGGKTTVPRLKLEQEGFNFHYYTSVYTTRDGRMYYYCYDQGYLPLDKQFVLLVVNKDRAMKK
jgi:hypothetical protein